MLQCVFDFVCITCISFAICISISSRLRKCTLPNVIRDSPAKFGMTHGPRSRPAGCAISVSICFSFARHLSIVSCISGLLSCLMGLSSLLCFCAVHGFVAFLMAFMLCSGLSGFDLASGILSSSWSF